MKCGRCNIELGQAATHNAYYIKNIEDNSTYGDVEVDEFALTKADGKIETSFDFKDLQLKESTENITATTAIDNKQVEIDTIKIQIDQEKDIDLKTTSLFSYETKLSELSILNTKKQQIHIESKMVIKSVPKTLIICKNCKKDNDTIIW